MTVVAYPTYDKYRDDITPWLGEVPADWRFEKAKWFLSHRKKINSDAKIDNVLSLTLRGVVNNDPDNPEGLVPKDYRTYQIFESDDLVFKLIDLENVRTSRVGLVHEQGIMSSAYIRIVPPKDWNARFLYYYYFHMYQAEVFNKIGSGVRSTLGQSDLLDLPIPVLDCEVQDNIVRFLDAKTAKIEAAIALEERQIALLKERKQIVIQNAVTKGLNPNAPMKDSGVDWIGEIPAHWEVRRNAAIFTESKRSGNASLPVLSVSIHSGVSDRELSDDENIRSAIKIEDRTAYKEVRPGFVTYNMMRAWQGGIGAVRTLGMVSPAYVVLEPKIALNSDYFEYLYRTPAFIWQMDCNSKGITDFRKRLYWEEFKTLVTLLPPAEEQAAISTVIAEKLAVIDGGVALKHKQIAALKEYKATLINSAVTGKIKVA